MIKTLHKCTLFAIIVAVTTLFIGDVATVLAQDEPASGAVPEWMAAPTEEGADDPFEGLRGQYEQSEAPSFPAYAYFNASNVWMMICAGLVFIMHLGFATLESGLCQSKNSVNILAKNTFIISMGILTYYLLGFNTMYPADWIIPGVFALGGPAEMAAGSANQVFGYYGGAYPGNTDFLFQAMFAATAATIVSGAVAERIKLVPFMIFTTLFVGICYPILGSWKWGGGWLDGMGFYDFAGSTLVHSVGGWGALAGAILLGARNGKYVDGKPRFLPMSNLPLATIGVFLLWLGWFGFNGGSVLSSDPNLTSLTLVTTNIAAASGVLAGLFTAWVVFKRADISFALNGALAGLVGITASADSVAPWMAVIIGLVAGILVVISVMMFDALKVDDPVGAISVHLSCGVWGTLAAGIFGGYNLGVQFIGVVAYGAGAFIFAFVLFMVLKATMGIRVSPEEEAEGLDKGEHHLIAYDMPEKLS